MTDIKNTWKKPAESLLLGRKIVSVDFLDLQDTEALGWVNSSVVITLDNGTIIYPSRDDEGNDAGAIHYIKKGDEDYVIPTIPNRFV